MIEASRHSRRRGHIVHSYQGGRKDATLVIHNPNNEPLLDRDGQIPF